MAEELASELGMGGWAVVSGGAFGIDAAAHRGAIAVGSVSIAVSAAGADRPAPAANTSLFMRLYDTGAVISEVPLGASPKRSGFLVRNRVIAALARCVVVVEAGVRSGARSTAREAQALGRVVAAVPGPATSAASAGCHEMIRDEQAVLVTCAEHVIELVTPGAERALPSQLRPAEQLVLDLLSADHEPAEVVADRARVTVGETVAALLSLEDRGLAQRDRHGWAGTSSGLRAGSGSRLGGRETSWRPPT